jgi:hypothetical protein
VVCAPPEPVQDARADQAPAWVRQLSSTITAGKARAGLETLPPERKRELSTFAFEYIARFFVGLEGRETVMKVLADVPVIQPERRQAADVKASAELAAKLFVVSKRPPNVMSSEIKIATIAIGEIDESNACKRCPEVFVSDAEFAEWAGMDKEAFWALGEKRVAKARKALLRRKPFV